MPLGITKKPKPIVKKVRKKNQEPKKFYIMLDEHTGEHRLAEQIPELESEMVSVLEDTSESSYMRVFEAVEMDFEVTNNPRVDINRKKS